MCQPPWQLALAYGGDVERKWINFALGVSSVCYVVAISAKFGMGVSGFFLAVVAQLAQASLAVKDATIGSRNDFLWVKQSVDNTNEVPKVNSGDEVSALRAEVKELRTMLTSSSIALSALVKAVEGFE